MICSSFIYPILIPYILFSIFSAVAPSVECPPGVRVVEGEGKILMPAGIDVHTHFTAPNSADDLGRGSKAAVAGGTATVRI